MCYIRMLAGSPHDPLCYSVHIRESAGFTAGDQGESNLSQVPEERGLPQARRKASAGQRPSSVLRRGTVPARPQLLCPRGLGAARTDSLEVRAGVRPSSHSCAQDHHLQVPMAAD